MPDPGCAAPDCDCTAAAAASAGIKSIETAAHDTYVAVISGNNVDTLMADLTDDVAYQSPGELEIVGKAAVRRWGTAYYGSTQTHWNKTPIGFTVKGDWAFERYHYESADTDRKTGAVTRDTGKGINVFQRGRDGRWRVALDGWSSDRAAGS